MAPRHRVFVSYHHENDQAYKNIFELRFGNKFGVVIPGSVDTGDIDPGLKPETARRVIRDDYLRDTTVTVVLVGTETWSRKHIDWEIGSSIIETDLNPRSGLLGILLPSHPSYGKSTYDPYIVPPRLHENVQAGYAVMYYWSNDADTVSAWVHQAFLRRKTRTPTQSFPPFARNRAGTRWHY